MRSDEQLDERAMVGLDENFSTAATWLRSVAADYGPLDHTEMFLVNEVLLRLASDFAAVANAVQEAARNEVILPADRIRQLYRRLAWTFRVEVTSFERKRYASLSNEPNKASNLNSYIGLMGGSYREATCSVRAHASSPAPRTRRISRFPTPTTSSRSTPTASYSPSIAFASSTCSNRASTAAWRSPRPLTAPSRERVRASSGSPAATTDLQHLVHQGLTYYEATFWVGANAVIRKAALDDIAVTSYRGDWEIREFVRDRTVIEDTESTLDLGIHGWKLFNYPERLSYSATPPDFGTLTIQRRRWANGGLLILPKLRRQRRAARESGYRVRFGEVFLRWNYMASVCTSSVSLLVLLAFPFNATLINPLLGAVALPYFVAMASDLRYCGYRRRDVTRIYGLNLILVPVNLAGTVSSLTQAITASKSAFVRTPKVRDRTVTPAFFLVAPYALLALAGYTLFVAYRNDFLENMGYASLNVVLAFYAIVAFIGLRHSLADAWVHFKSLLYKRERPQRRRFSPMRKRPAAPAPPHWQEVLQVGPAYARAAGRIRAGSAWSGRAEGAGSSRAGWPPPSMGRSRLPRRRT